MNLIQTHSNSATTQDWLSATEGIRISGNLVAGCVSIDTLVFPDLERVRYASREKVAAASGKVFKRHASLFQKLAQ